jgi:hypothetical protein
MLETALRSNEMPFQSSDVEDFYAYLGQQLHVGHGAKSPEEFLDEWRRLRERQQTVAAVNQGQSDAEAGRMRPLRELLDERGNLNRTV